MLVGVERHANGHVARRIGHDLPAARVKPANEPVEVVGLEVKRGRRSRAARVWRSVVFERQVECASFEEGIVGILRGDRLQTIELSVGQIVQDRERCVDSDLKVTRPSRLGVRGQLVGAAGHVLHARHSIAMCLGSRSA